MIRMLEATVTKIKMSQLMEKNRYVTIDEKLYHCKINWLSCDGQFLLSLTYLEGNLL